MFNIKAAFKLPKIKAFDITGRPMKDWIMGEKDAFPNDNNLKEWLKKAKVFNALNDPLLGQWSDRVNINKWGSLLIQI